MRYTLQIEYPPSPHRWFAYCIDSSPSPPRNHHPGCRSSKAYTPIPRSDPEHCSEAQMSKRFPRRTVHPFATKECTCRSDRFALARSLNRGRKAEIFRCIYRSAYPAVRPLRIEYHFALPRRMRRQRRAFQNLGTFPPPRSETRRYHCCSAILPHILNRKNNVRCPRLTSTDSAPESRAPGWVHDHHKSRSRTRSSQNSMNPKYLVPR